MTEPANSKDATLLVKPVKFELDSYRRHVPDEELIADLQRISSELGMHSITRAKYSGLGKFSASTLTKRFGSWFIALEKAGLEKTNTHPKRFTDEDLFRNMEEVWTRLGRQPRREEFAKPLSDYSNGTYEKRFGTWRRALEAFVAYIDSEENTSSQEPVKRLTAKPTTRSLKKADATELTIKRKTTRTVNWRVRFIVMRGDNFRCRLCGQTQGDDPSTKLEVDHIKAWIKGGETVLENLQTLCRKCNAGKSDLEFLDSSPTEVQNVEA